MEIVQNLTFDQDTLKQILRNENKRALAFQPIVLNDNIDIALKPNKLYYGNLYSRLGVTVNYNAKVLAEVQGTNELEVLFDSLTALGNSYKFFGYEITLQN